MERQRVWFIKFSPLQVPKFSRKPEKVLRGAQQLMFSLHFNTPLVYVMKKIFNKHKFCAPLVLIWPSWDAGRNKLQYNWS